MSSHHYLVIRPFSNDPEMIEPHVDSLAIITGLDKLTVRQKFTGTALQVLKSHQKSEYLEDIATKLKVEGLASALISKNDILNVPKPLRISSFELGQKKISLINRNKGAIASLDGSQKCLLVLTTMNIKTLKRKRMAKLVMARSRSFPHDEILHFIFREHPIMDLYLSNYNAPLRVNSLRFNYNCLGADNKKSVALNFPSLIKLIKNYSSEVIIDTGFGEENLPFLGALDNLDGERLLREFTLYSRFISISYEKDIFNSGRSKTSLIDTSMFKDLSNLFWAGPLFLQHMVPKKEKKTSSNSTELKKSSGISSPSSPKSMIFEPKGISMRGRGLAAYIKSSKRYLRSLGPPFLVYPIIIAIFASSYIGYSLETFLFIPAVFILIGILSFIHSFVLLGRKRGIENCPTSKIRSMPMGLVEVKGYAKQKHFLRAPFSQTDCVYYSYKVYETEQIGTKHQIRLREWGESGKIPFYLEDETGKTLVFPENAIIKAGTSQDMSRSILDIFADPRLSYGEGSKKVVENVIPVGHFLYVMGYAHPHKTSSMRRRQSHLDKLRELKRDKQKMKRYDLDGDGNISTDEWELARKDIEEEMLMEKTDSSDDHIAISEHPSGGLFYIADKREEFLTASLAWRIPLFLISGIFFIAFGITLLSIL